MALPGQIQKVGRLVDEGCYHEGCTSRPMYSYCVEADSMGEELEYYCENHIESLKAALKSRGPIIGSCEGCRATGVEVKPCRAWDEGNNGPVYDWCVNCRQSNADDANAALDDMHDDDAHDNVNEVLSDLEDDGFGLQDPGPEEEYANNQWISTRMVESAGYITPMRVEIVKVAPTGEAGSIYIYGILSDTHDYEGTVPIESFEIMGRLDLTNGQLLLVESSDDLYDDFFHVFHFLRKVRRYGFPVAFVRKTEKMF